MSSVMDVTNVVAPLLAPSHHLRNLKELIKIWILKPCGGNLIFPRAFVSSFNLFLEYNVTVLNYVLPMGIQDCGSWIENFLDCFNNINIFKV